MCEIPIDIDDKETIVRAIFQPYHVNKKGKLKPEAFKSPVGKDEVYVIRHTYMGTGFCKRKAKEIEAIGKEKGQSKTYKGLASLKAFDIRSVGSDLVRFDSGLLFFSLVLIHAAHQVERPSEL